MLVYDLFPANLVEIEFLRIKWWSEGAHLCWWSAVSDPLSVPLRVGGAVAQHGGQDTETGLLTLRALKIGGWSHDLYRQGY